MLRLDPLDRFNELASRPPGRARQVLVMLVGGLLIAAAWSARGPAVGVVALLVYGVLFGAVALRFEGTKRWSARHPRLDSLIFVPVAFLAFASLTSLSLWLCLLSAVGGWLVLLPVRLLTAPRGQSDSILSGDEGR